MFLLFIVAASNTDAAMILFGAFRPNTSSPEYVLQQNIYVKNDVVNEQKSKKILAF